MSVLVLEDVADTLRTARLQGQPVPAHTDIWPGLDADTAFQIQKLNVEHAVAGGDRLVGYKLGNIAKVMQDA